MTEETRRTGRRHSLFRQTVIWITGLICVAFLLATLAQAWSNNYLMQQVQDAQHALQQKQAQQGHLKRAVDYYKDPGVIESEARQRLGYVRPGEQAVVITNGTSQGRASAPQRKQTQETQGYWQDWWHIFFGR